MQSGRLEPLRANLRDRRRQVSECADTWYKRIQPSEAVLLFIYYLKNMG